MWDQKSFRRFSRASRFLENQRQELENFFWTHNHQALSVQHIPTSNDPIFQPQSQTDQLAVGHFWILLHINCTGDRGRVKMAQIGHCTKKPIVTLWKYYFLGCWWRFGSGNTRLALLGSGIGCWRGGIFLGFVWIRSFHCIILCLCLSTSSLASPSISAFSSAASATVSSIIVGTLVFCWCICHSDAFKRTTVKLYLSKIKTAIVLQPSRSKMESVWLGTYQHVGGNWKDCSAIESQQS